MLGFVYFWPLCRFSAESIIHGFSVPPDSADNWELYCVCLVLEVLVYDNIVQNICIIVLTEVYVCFRTTHNELEKNRWVNPIFLRIFLVKVLVVYQMWWRIVLVFICIRLSSNFLRLFKLSRFHCFHTKPVYFHVVIFSLISKPNIAGYNFYNTLFFTRHVVQQA